MNDSTIEVRTASAEMEQGNKIILSQIQQLQNSTLSMKNCMDEMSAGTQKIGETGSALGEISGKVQKAIDEIGGQVDQFKV